MGIFVGSIAKRRAYGRSGLAASTILLAPKRTSKIIIGRGTPSSQSSAPRVPLPFSFKPHVSCQTPAPNLEFPSREKVFTEGSLRPTGSRREDRARPNLSLATGGAARGRREGRRARGNPSAKNRKKSKVLWPQPKFFLIGQESQQPQGPCRARHQAHNPLRTVGPTRQCANEQQDEYDD
jgi:hypothetical protein